MDAWALAETDRVLSNMIRIGTVAALDEAAARVTVDVGGLITDWLPWLTARAGNTRTWSAPRPGEQVLVLAPYGDLGQAVALPALYQQAHPAPQTSAGIEAVHFPDGAAVTYDSAAHLLTVNAGSARVVINCQQASINASGSVTLNTPATTCTGTLTVQGHLTYAAGMTGTGTAAIAGDLAVSGGLTNKGVSVGAGHRHTGVEPGEKMSGPPV
nr:MAG TPA: baseplate assembly protein [Caudoviricetes sp.]